jgi:hypothetical protein
LCEPRRGVNRGEGESGEIDEEDYAALRSHGFDDEDIRHIDNISGVVSVCRTGWRI